MKLAVLLMSMPHLDLTRSGDGDQTRQLFAFLNAFFVFRSNTIRGDRVHAEGYTNSYYNYNFGKIIAYVMVIHLYRLFYLNNVASFMD